MKLVDSDEAVFARCGQRVEGSIRIYKKSVEGKWLEAAEVDSTRD